MNDWKCTYYTVYLEIAMIEEVYIYTFFHCEVDTRLIIDAFKMPKKGPQKAVKTNALKKTVYKTV